MCHGVAVADPYRWLEDGEAPEVEAWRIEQEKHLRAYLDARCPAARPSRRGCARSSPSARCPRPCPRRGRYFYEKSTGAQEQPVLYVREGRDGADRVLLDPARLARRRGLRPRLALPVP